MKHTSLKRQHRVRRHGRVRARVKGTADRPRVSVFKSNQNIFVQFIDDDAGKTVLSNKIVEMKKVKSKNNKIQAAEIVGENLAKVAKEAGINKIVFDRGGFKYHGRVKAVAEGLRKGGINF